MAVARIEDLRDERADRHPPADHGANVGRPLPLSRRNRLGRNGNRDPQLRTVDDRRAADLVFDGLRLPANALLGEEGQAWLSLAKARDEGAAAIWL
jgi:alkylation response protein AidB-like acyl-CoA dehydrogenase